MSDHHSRMLKEALAMVEPDANDGLKLFARELIRASWEGCDGGDIIQEAAGKYGLIKQVPFDPATHTDDTGYCGVGDPWFVFCGVLLP